MLKHWIPWKFLIQRAARSYGVIDPIDLLARLRRFAQPSEIQEPLELLRAGIVFHARGLINTRAIQHNLDWIWPYWVEKQFDPGDVAFMPRGVCYQSCQFNSSQLDGRRTGQFTALSDCRSARAGHTPI